MTQPVARVEVVRDNYYGTIIEDPYRWMEDMHSEEVQSWIRAQAEHTRAYLDALPERSALLQRITELDNVGTYCYGFTPAGSRIFYLRREPGEDLPKLVVRGGEEEKTLVDPNQLTGVMHSAIDWYYPSRDGQRVAYGVSQGGSEDSTLYVVEVESGQVHDLAISRTGFCVVNWLEDHRTFLYTRYPALPAGAPLTERFKNNRVYLHRPGNDPEHDLCVFGYGVNSRVEILPEDEPYLCTSSVSDWMLAVVRYGGRHELTIYVAPRSALFEPATCPWTKVADVEDEVTGYAFIGDTIYFRTHKDAPRYKVIATSLRNPDLAHAMVIVPESQVVIEDILVAGEYLVTRDLDGGIGRMRRVPLSGGEPEAIALPVEGTMRELVNQDAAPDLLVYLTSWTVSPRFYRCNVADKALVDTGCVPPSPVDMSEIEVHEVFAPGKDGTPIPLSIMHRKGLVRDGNNPTILRGYGSHGISMRALFMPTLLAWYERGGVFAVAHMRGGGEYGDGWHKAGQKINKGNTIDDFIACAEYLIEQGYTRPERLAGQGGSAGGIPTGGALVRRPDLRSVMLMHVPVVNALRFEFTENGPSNIPEFGCVTTEDGFKGLAIMDAYSKVKDGIRYPAVLLTAGINDPRVVAWQPAKMAARLQNATTSGKPVLLRVEFQGGHGMGATKQQLDEELADVLAFLLQQFCL
jgi:prolyl oligopeptidase